MDQRAIFLPVAAQVMLTLLVLGLIPYRRINAAFRGLVTPEDFTYGESANVPPAVSVPNRNMMNLLELPLLFYVGCIVLFLLGSVDRIFVWMSWAYVLLRVVHSIIHLTYNKTVHRLVPFAASNFVLVAFWIRLTFELARKVS